MTAAPDNLTHLVQGPVEALGYELVGVEYLSAGRGATLRIYIDHPNGILLEDCARVSRQVSSVLDVEDPISENYQLEVSSPGLDRPLFTREHYARYTGCEVSVRTSVKVGGRRRFKGILIGLEGDQLVLKVDGEPVSLELDNIERARLVPDLGLGKDHE